MEKRVTTTVRMPEEMLDEIRRIAQEEERPLNTQLLRLIRTGLERYRAEHPATPRSDVQSE
jgi:hypothetical protein